jgi:DNA-binding HxlR family transcriptional regulator
MFLSFNGGVLGLDHERMTNDVSNALKSLVAKGAITKTSLSGTSKHEYKLTTIGSNLVDLIKEN